MSPKQHDDGIAEKNALELVKKTGSKGILQSELWRQLGLNSREGSRVALRLEKKGLIRRDKELNGGRWTYRLYPVNDGSSDLDGVTWDTLGDCPCFVCGSLSSCGIRQLISPAKCDNLSEWIIQQVQIQKTKIKSNPSQITEKAKSMNS
ncbi:MAG: helix-turn-helix transcriptional regulator [Candidatus Helarchaeales archaeon]